MQPLLDGHGFLDAANLCALVLAGSAAYAVVAGCTCAFRTQAIWEKRHAEQLNPQPPATQPAAEPPAAAAAPPLALAAPTDGGGAAAAPSEVGERGRLRVSARAREHA